MLLLTTCYGGTTYTTFNRSRVMMDRFRFLCLNGRKPTQATLPMIPIFRFFRFCRQIQKRTSKSIPRFSPVLVPLSITLSHRHGNHLLTPTQTSQHPLATSPSQQTASTAPSTTRCPTQPEPTNPEQPGESKGKGMIIRKHGGLLLQYQ